MSVPRSWLGASLMRRAVSRDAAPGLAEQPWTPSHSGLLAQGSAVAAAEITPASRRNIVKKRQCPATTEDVPERAHRSMAGSRASAPLSAAPILESRGRNAIAAGLLAAIQRRISDPEHLLGDLVVTTRDLVHAAQAEACSHRDGLLAGVEGGVRDGSPQLAGDVERRFITRLRHDDGKFLTANPRHPVNPAAQSLLQPRAELLQDLVANGVTERVVDLLEVVDVAQSQGQGALVTRGPFDLTREVLAEEAPAGSARQFVRRRQLAVLLQRNTQYRLELGDAPRRADARVQLGVAHSPADAFIGPGEDSRLPFLGVIDLGHEDNERRPCGLPRPQFAYQLQAVGEHDRAKLGAEATQGLLLVGDRVAVQHVGRDAPLHMLAQRYILKNQERLRRRQHPHHDRDSRSSPLLDRRGLSRTSLQDPLDDCRVSPGRQSDPLMPEVAPTGEDYRHGCAVVSEM